jgi:hypothetical protein
MGFVSEPTLPVITVIARTRNDPPKLVAQFGPRRTLDLSGGVKDLVKRLRTNALPLRDTLSIECIVELIEGKPVPELFLEPSVVADLVAGQTRFEVELTKASGAGELPGSLPAIRVEFVVRGLGFDPAALTERIGLEPDRVNRADRASLPRSLDTWTYGGRLVRGSTFEPLLESLLVALTPRTREIRDFCREHKAEAVVSFVAEFVDSAPRLAIAVSDLARINDLGAAVWYDPYLRTRLG